MIHTMGLFEEPFQAIKSGKKTIEVRLNDEKRQRLAVGDWIEFSRLPDKDDMLEVKIVDLQQYNTFVEMYQDMPPEDLGASDSTIEHMVENTYQIYTPEQEKRWGALAITVGKVKKTKQFTGNAKWSF